MLTENPFIEQLNKFEARLEGDDPQWEGTDYGLNLKDIIAYARDGLRLRDENFAFAEEMERQKKDEIHNDWEENHYTLKNVKDERTGNIVQTTVYRNQSI